MIISDAGIHTLTSEHANITPDTHAHLLDIPDASESTCTLYVEDGATVEIFGLFHGWTHTRKVVCTGERSRAILRYILPYNQKDTLTAKIIWDVAASHSCADIHILSLIENGTIDLDGSIYIRSGLSQAAWHIQEENIFLGDHGAVRGIPSLFVHSCDVEASHAARIEKIPEEKLVYLRARGIDEQDAVSMMIQSSIATVLEWLSTVDPQAYKEYLASIRSVLHI